MIEKARNARRFIGWSPPAKVQKFQNSQFDQKQPLWPSGVPGVGKPVGHPIFPDDKTGGYEFDSCNLINCEPPVGSIVKTCNTALIERDIFVRLATKEDVVRKRARKVGDNVLGIRAWGRWTPAGYEYSTKDGVTPEIVV